jgi:cell shape-determining protein MreC
MLFPSWTLLVLATSISGASCKSDHARVETSTRIDDLTRENKELRSRVKELEQRLETVIQAYDEDVGFRSGPRPIEAVVLEVNPELRLVILNKGEKDGVEKDYVFDVYRWSTYKGQVRIQDVQEGESTGLILNELNPITRGDAATTYL